MRAGRRGDWTTLTSPHHPTGAATAVTHVAAVGPASRLPGPVARGHYDWAAEVVALDEVRGTLTVTSRLVTAAARTAVAGLEAGAPIIITWSGLTTRAAGIRAVARRDGSGLWGGDRFLLPATFVGTDPAGAYLTFAVKPPADGLAMARTLRRGDWATLTSPHRPRGPADAVTTLAAFTPAPRVPGPVPSGRYHWAAELVALDEARGTLTVTSPLVTAAARTAVAELEPGAAIIITWSGLSAPAEGLATARALRRGDWAILTSPHRPRGVADTVTTVAAYSLPRPTPRRTYHWAGELVAFDPAALEVSVSAPVEPHVFRYVDRFRAGDPVVLIWTPAAADGLTDIRYRELRDPSTLDHGYVLPVEFVSADATRQRLTFKTPVRPGTVTAPATLRPGSQIRVTSAFEQDGETAAIVTVEEAVE